MPVPLHASGCSVDGTLPTAFLKGARYVAAAGEDAVRAARRRANVAMFEGPHTVGPRSLPPRGWPEALFFGPVTRPRLLPGIARMDTKQKRGRRYGGIQGGLVEELPEKIRFRYVPSPNPFPVTRVRSYRPIADCSRAALSTNFGPLISWRATRCARSPNL